MHICFITNKYPNEVEPNAIVFLQQLVIAIAKQCVKCSVICPVPTNIYKKYKVLPHHRKELFDGAEIDVYYPRYFGLGQSDIGPFNPAKITTHFFTKAVDKTLKKLDTKPDCIYSHFVTPAGITAARIGKKYNIPSFMAYGEATLGTIEHFGKKAVKKELVSLNGVIAVSTQNKNMISPFVKPNITEIFPNSVDDNVFYPRNKENSRKKLGLNKDDFVISFVGSFDERKGIDRLSDAIDRVNDAKIKLICAGSGSLSPSTNSCIFSKSVLHSDLPEFLSASDIFVLPTLNEGCCNAIVEAMACGLPIISSNREFNFDILDKTNSIMIDPTSVEEIALAIKTLRDNESLCRELSNGSLTKAKELTLNSRAKNILAFMEKIDEQSKNV